MNSDYYSWKSKFFIPGDIWPFNLVSEFLENSMLHTNEESCFIFIVCSFRRIGFIITRKRSTNSEYLTGVRVEKHFEFILVTDIKLCKLISAYSRLFHAIAWISVFSGFTRLPAQSLNFQGNSMYKKLNASVRRCNCIVCIMKSAYSFVFAAHSILHWRPFKRKVRYILRFVV